MGAAEPIAVVGRACVLPGALSPAALWDAVLAGRDLLGRAPEGRWGLPRALALTPDPRHAEDRAWSDVGGYVDGFDAVFDPTGFAGLDADDVLGLDPLFRWTLHGVRGALRDAGFDGRSDRAGLIMGNLSFPPTAMARYAEHHWLGAQGKGFLGGMAADLVGLPHPHARNRFASGLPAHLAASATGLQGGAYALDAACASSLYAIKLACDRLRDGTADLMVAGAVNRADDLFLHVGFCALSALSKTGRSRPFHRDADGLVPAEGAGFVALKRLSDALAAGDTVHGVIRGVGLSNDGRAAGFLSPSAAGQVRALRAAYAEAGLAPSDVSLVECHATGTAVGDRAEIDSLREVFAGAADVPLGSLKSNLGHLITAAGAAGLIKILEAFRAGVRPPSAHADSPTDALKAPFRVLAKPEPWPSDRPRIAALSAFGFGGNNGHLIVEDPATTARPTSARRPAPDMPLAIVAVAARIGATTSTAQTVRAVLSGASLVNGGAARATAVTVPAEGLRFPPTDLQVTLPQQLLVLGLAIEATAGLDLPPERTAVLVGMGVDAEIARYGARWRLAGWAPAWGAAVGSQPDGAWLQAAQDALAPTLVAAGVVGTMPNIPANRVNRQLGLSGPSFTVSSEEASGLRALEIASRALRAGEIDAAVVGAVEFSDEPVHCAALSALGHERIPGDAGVVLVVERLDDARRAGHPVVAVLPGTSDEPTMRVTPRDLEARLGAAHAASGLVAVAAAAWAVHHGVRDGAPWEGPRNAEVSVDALGGQHVSVRIGAEGPTAALPDAMAPGRTLTFPAHQAPVVLPPIPAGTPLRTTSASAGTMPSAPALPPITEAPPVTEGPADEPIALPAAVAPEHERSLAFSAQPQAAPDAGLLASFAALQQRLGEVHRQHLAHQQALHAQFLDTRTRATAMLFDAWGRAGTAIDTSAQPAWAPAPPAPPIAPTPAAAPTPPATTSASPPTPAAPPRAPLAAPATPKAPAPIVEPDAAAVLPGPKYDRKELEVLASGRISDVFGPAFARQDGFHRQVRMPEPPLLLADRVTGIDAVPGSMKTGTLWTETDVRADSWYLHDGRMPSGVMIESGQADLLLISWLGADFHNRSERVYRLLGCTLTYHARDERPGTVLPVPGETLVYDIHVDGHANQGPIRLFFFHYDCRIGGRPRLTVRGGQAGFFTDAELADSGGVLWDASTGEHDPDAIVAPAPIAGTRHAFTREQVGAFAEGRPAQCFGPGWEATAAHVWTPRIPSGDLRFLHEVTAFDAAGGPWKRGYLRAESPIAPSDWFFDGHFKNDPCMPGTMMFEGCIQAMAFYLSALGFTVARDGWTFEPVPEVAYKMVCRGQVTPASRHLVYEVFVESVEDGPHPTLWADLLCTVDGLKAFHARHVGLRLVPDWPLSRPEGRRLLTDGPVPGHVAPSAANARPPAFRNGFAYGLPSLLACAWGRPSEAFGPIYAPFDSPRKVARLPGPPYHFMTRIASIDADAGQFKAGVTVQVEYDVPPDAWYFAENGAAAMPFAVLMEAALQPCGWLASYVGGALSSDSDLLFRNLDGKGTLHRPVRPGDGTMVTRATLKTLSKSAGMVLVGFDVACRIGDETVFTMDTVFGFFPPAAFENQVGVGATPAWTEALEAPSNAAIDLSGGPLDRVARLPRPMLRMIDRITGWWPDGGVHGKGRIRAEKDVDASEWFFKAHFFQDPVQPGSLGVEALCTLLQAWMLQQGLDEGLSDASFEPVMTGEPSVWRYRGQVVPTNRRITTICDVIESGRDAKGPFVIATGSLWVDGKRIYHLERFGMRLVQGGTDRADRGGSTGKVRQIGIAAAAPWLVRSAPTSVAQASEETLDPARDAWLADHCPTWTVPALPMTCMLDRLAAVAGGAPLTLRDVQIHRWLTLPGPVRIRTESEPKDDGTIAVRLLAWRDAPNPALSRFEPIATGIAVRGTPTPPAPLAPLADAAPVADPYASGALFHGPAFQLLSDLQAGATGATATLRADSDVPYGTLNPALLDAATHTLPHDDVRRWDPTLPEGHAAYPIRVVEARFFAAPPRDGTVRVDARYLGRTDGPGGPRPTFGLRLSTDAVVAELVLEEVLVPKGPIGMAPAPDRLAFLRDRQAVPGLGLSAIGPETTLTTAALRQSDWLPGTVASAYDAHGTDLVAEVAVKDHVAALAGAHPSRVFVAPDGLSATSAHHPLTRWPITIARRGDTVTVRDGGEQQDLSPVVAWWREWFGLGHWPVEDLYYGLIERFVRRVTVEDPASWARAHGRSVLYLANHQVMCESLLFSVLISALGGVPTVTLAKVEHKASWLGRLIDHAWRWPGARDPDVIAFFDRDDKRSLPRIIGELAAAMSGPGKSVMVHVEGTRSLTCTTVEKMSSSFIDMAIATNSPIVPVRFSGGLPVEPLPERIEFPIGHGRQDYVLGRALFPEELASMPLRERKETMLAALNGTGRDDGPFSGDPALDAASAAHAARTGAEPAHATILEVLRARSDLHPALVPVVAGETSFPDTPEGRWLDVLSRRLYGRDA